MQEENVVTLNATIYPWQKGLLEDYRQKESCLSISEALRRLLTAFNEMTDKQYQIPTRKLLSE